jgi:hypothetical protein
LCLGVWSYAKENELPQTKEMVECLYAILYKTRCGDEWPHTKLQWALFMLVPVQYSRTIINFSVTVHCFYVNFNLYFEFKE